MLNLQLFADGGAAAGGDGGTAQGQGVTAGAASQQTKGASLADVKYGIQPEETAPAAEVQKETAEPTDLNAEFEALVKGKYKAQYDARMQDTIQKRLKGSNETIAKYKNADPIMDILAKKYGMDASDISGLAKAVAKDGYFFEEAAMRNNRSVEDEMAIQAVNRENEMLAEKLEKLLKEKQTAQAVQSQYDLWMEREKEAKQFYPNFNMEIELQNPDFVELLNSNISVKAAYQLIHMDEIIPASMQFAAQAVEQNIAKKIAANGVRPSENGMGSQASAVVKSDVSKLTKMDIDEVARRVARGEKISFG
jgi:hypothetical protein